MTETTGAGSPATGAAPGESRTLLPPAPVLSNDWKNVQDEPPPMYRDVLAAWEGELGWNLAVVMLNGTAEWVLVSPGSTQDEALGPYPGKRRPLALVAHPPVLWLALD